MKLAAAAAGISKISAGPLAVAVEFRRAESAPWNWLEQASDRVRGDDRLICKRATEPGPERLQLVRELMGAMAPAGAG